jgi:hypothetical protein
MVSLFPAWLAVFLLLAAVLAIGGLAAYMLIAQRLRAPVPHASRSEVEPLVWPAAAISRRTPAPAAAGPCPVCGAPIPADSPQGLCPQCLFRCALSQSDRPPEPAAAVDTGPYSGPTPAPAAAELAPLFPQFDLLELIGQGGMGAVYKARQVKLDRLVAVKILPAEWGKDPAFAERFAREARALARLSHPHIVAVHDFGEAGGLFYLVMEYVDGANLRQLLLGRDWEPRRALEVVPQVCDALQYAHEEGVVHRDIKPENILVDRRGNVKIADFGLAKLLRRSAAEFSLTGSRQVMGTLDYMAPEQRTTPTEVDHRADVFALGVVFYEMLTGELPLGRFAPPSERAGVDARLDEVVFRALERDPGRRYQRISEIKTDLELLRRATPGAGPSAVPLAAPLGDADADLELVRMRVRGPAAGLVITGILVIVQAFVFAVLIYQKLPEEFATELPLVLVLGVPAVAAGITIIAGALRLARLESHGLALAAMILALLPFSYHVLLGLPMALWAFWALRGPQVEAAYLLTKRQAARWRAARAQSGQIGARGVPGQWPHDAANLEQAGLQVRGPAIGLGITGAFLLVEVIVFVSNVGIRGDLRDLGLAILGILGLAAGATMIRGAVLMSQLENYRLVTAAILLAILPFSYHVLVGLPVGLWAFWVLRGPQVEAAYLLTKRQTARWRAASARPPHPEGRGVAAAVRSAWGSMLSMFVHRPTAVSTLSEMDHPAKPEPLPRPSDPGIAQVPGHRPRAMWVALFMAAVIGSLCLGVMAARLLIPVTYYGEAPPVESKQPLAFYRGTTSHLSLTSEQAKRLDEVLRSADEDYLKLEAEHSQRQQDGSQVKVTILPFTKEVGALEERVWKQLGVALDQWQLRQARELLPLHGSLFPFGNDEVTIEIEPAQRGVRWRVMRGGAPGKGVWFEGDNLPQEYHRFAPKF